MASRKRLYLHRVRCEECNKEIDSDYKEVHSRLVHNGKKVKCHPVMESSDSSQSLMHTERISYIKYVIATSRYVSNFLAFFVNRNEYTYSAYN